MNQSTRSNIDPPESPESSISGGELSNTQNTTSHDSLKTSDAEKVIVPRRSGRITKQIEPRSAWQPKPHVLYIGKDVVIPNSYSEAINGVDRVKWQAAIDEELESLQIKDVFIPVSHIPHDRKPVGSKWIFSVKSDGRFRARLVAQGFSQVHGINYFDTYSPTLKMDSLRILLAVATFCDWEIHQLDIKTAYLEGDIQEEIYMKCPEGMNRRYVKINKALYGLKQSGKAWYEKLDAKLSFLNFKKSEADHCVYVHSSTQIVIGVYVDDLIICGKVLEQVVAIKKQLSSFFRVKDLGLIDVVIGWKINRDRSKRTLSISQSNYLTEKIRSFGLEDAKTYSTPLNGYDGIVPRVESEQLADESAYASAIGSLGYAANSSRPDISFATCQLGRFNSSPVFRHWNTACRVLRYLKGTKEYCITYNFGPKPNLLTPELKPTLYSDSDFASDVTTRRSVSGYVLMIGGGPVCWQSKQQKSVSTSTTEAEYMALCEAAKQAVWVTRLLEELHVADKLIDEGGILSFTDNQSALAIAKGTNSSKTKHIDVAYHFIRECIQAKKINLKYIATDKMLADILTKPLPQQKAKSICEQIFNKL